MYKFKDKLVIVIDYNLVKCSGGFKKILPRKLSLEVG